jgi:hypothetical protein
MAGVRGMGRKIAYLENGEPHFRFFYRGSGKYSVYVVRPWGGEDVLIGEICTSSPIAHGRDPGRWRATSLGPVDSMNAAAELLLYQIESLRDESRAA